jgi:hypothetical protein
MSTQDFSTGWGDTTTTSFSTGWSSSTTGGSSGGSFTIPKKGGGGGGGAGSVLRPRMEQVVRSFVDERILAIRARRKARDEDTTDDSLIRWGRPARFGNSDVTKEEDERGFEIVDPKPPPKKPEDQKRQRVYSEVTRSTETVRVFNPTDSAQYVDVQRIKSITFRGPDGIDVRFDLKPPA